MKIVTITYNDLGISWGPAIHFLELWNSVASLHPEIDVEGLAPTWTARSPILRSRFRLAQIRVPNISKSRQVIYDLKIAARLLFRATSDVVYIRLSQFHLFSTLTLRLRRNPVFLELNGLLVDDAVSAKRSGFFRRFVRWQERTLVHRARGIIAVSQGITDAILTNYHPAGRVITLKNGVGLNFFIDPADHNAEPGRPPTSRRPAVLYVGTFTPWDGAMRIVELARRFPQVDFHFVGDGPALKAVQAQATANMSFFGRADYADLPRFYRSADAGIVLYETKRHQRVHLSSLKTLEYLASGLPVFTTNVPGQEYVADLGCGVLAGEDTLIEDFSAFLRKLPDYRRTAESTRAAIRRDYSWENVAHKTVAFVRGLVKLEPSPTQDDEK